MAYHLDYLVFFILHAGPESMALLLSYASIKLYQLASPYSSH